MAFSSRPSETRDTHYTVPDWAPKNETEFVAESERLKDDIRGIKVAQLRQDKKIEQEKLEQKTITLKIEKTKTKGLREDLKTETFRLVGKRATAAQEQDKAHFGVESWRISQVQTRTKIESLELGNRNESQKLINDRKAALADFN